MELTGCIVKSQAGHDSDRFYLVVLQEGDFCYIADGKLRTLEKPKRKNKKHIKKTNSFLDVGSVLTNKQLRELLQPFHAKT